VECRIALESPQSTSAHHAANRSCDTFKKQPHQKHLVCSPALFAASAHLSRSESWHLLARRSPVFGEIRLDATKKHAIEILKAELLAKGSVASG
jgi:hypothetical protein